MERSKITRLELYELVWTMSVREIAKERRASFWTVTMKCEQYAIPKPPLDYWRSESLRNSTERTPIDNPDWNPEIDLGRQRTRNRPAGEKAPRRSVPVPEKIDEYHQIVRQYLDTNPLESLDSKGFTRITKLSPLRIRVTPDAFERAILIADTLVREYEHHQYNLQTGHHEAYPGLQVRWEIYETFDVYIFIPRFVRLSRLFNFRDAKDWEDSKLGRLIITTAIRDEQKKRLYRLKNIADTYKQRLEKKLTLYFKRLQSAIKMKSNKMNKA